MERTEHVFWVGLMMNQLEINPIKIISYYWDSALSDKNSKVIIRCLEFEIFTKKVSFYSKNEIIQ